MTDLVAGIDVGGTKLLGLAVDLDTGEVLASGRVPTPAGASRVLDAIVGLADHLRTEVAASGRRIDALGLGAPGLVDRSGTLRYGPNVPGIVDLPLASVLGGRLAIPVVADNDATCAAWAEHELGAARGANHSVTVTLGTGIGAGITVKG